MLLKFKWPPPSISQSYGMNMNRALPSIWCFLNMHERKDLMNCLNLCTDPHLWLLDQETNCSIMRGIYTHTRWTFNVIWAPCWPGLVSVRVKGHASLEGSISHTWHLAVTCARRSVQSGAERAGKGVGGVEPVSCWQFISWATMNWRLHINTVRACCVDTH